MKSRNKIVRQYLRQVRKAVPCSGKERRQLVEQLEEAQPSMYRNMVPRQWTTSAGSLAPPGRSGRLFCRTKTPPTYSASWP